MSEVAQKDRLSFTHFPAYAKYLAENKLEEFVKISFDFSREEELAVMKLLEAIPPDQLMQIGLIGVKELLDAIADNNARRYIEDAMEKWMKNQLPIITRDSVVSEDITVGAFVRRRIFRHFLKDYVQDEGMKLIIMEEVDRFTTETELISYNGYISLQKEKLEEMNQELRNREQQLLEAQEIAEMGSFFWHLTDPSKSVYSPQMLKVFGMEKTGKMETFLEAVHPGDRAAVKDAIERSLKNNEKYQCEYRYNKNGEEIYIDSRGVVELENGIPVILRGTVRDITKKYRMLKQLRDLNDDLLAKNAELERSNKELESFNYIASHDLQEPLRKIQTFSSRLLDNREALPKNIAEYLDKINTSSVRMKNLIEDLLSFSQITTPVDAFETVDLNELLNEVKSSLSDIIETHQVQIVSEKLPAIKAVPFQFSQLFVNLITNSIKYKKEGVAPCITISASKTMLEKDLNCLLLTIADNGIGFESEYNEKIFDLFKRLHPKEKYSGTGIGLSICKKIVQNHGGHIVAEGHNGKGASFHIYLPEDRIAEPISS